MDNVKSNRQNKKRSDERILLTNEIIMTWLGIVNLFQTFEDLESVKDKQADIQSVRQVLDEDIYNEEDEK